MNEARIDISVCNKPEEGYVVSINARSRNQISDYRVSMTKDELKEFRGRLHSALIDINVKLEY